MEGVFLREVVIADDPQGWRDIGFTVDANHRARVGDATLRFEPPDVAKSGHRGVIGWSVPDLAGELDGLPDPGRPPGPPPQEALHANGAIAIDHVVVVTPDRERTVAALERAGLEVRRRREAAHPVPGRQAFFRLGVTILEVLEPDPPGNRDRPAWIAGLAFSATNLERVAALLGSALGRIRPAVQPGRSIAPVRRQAGVTTAVAFITPGVAADGR